MKRLCAFTLILIMLLSLTACGDKTETGKSKPGDSSQAAQQESDIIISTKWPDIDYIPVFKKGQLVEAFKDGNDNVNISFENVARSDFEDYLEIIKKEFPNHPVEEEDVYYGSNDKGSIVQINYYEDDNKLLNIQGVKQNK